MDSLLQDQEPSDSDWNTLFRTPGYRQLSMDTSLKETLRLAFMPSHQAELGRVLEENSYRSRILAHLRSLQKERKEVVSYRRSFDGQRVLRAAMQLSSQYLPKGLREWPIPTVAFLIFQPDGQANGGVIVLDALFAMRLGKGIIPFLGHEFHHYYKPQNLKEPDRSANDYWLVHAVKQIQLEGIADLIDKKSYPVHLEEHRRWYEEQYNDEYRRTPEFLRTIDELIGQIAAEPGKTKENSLEVWKSLKFGGHPNGFYMACLIVKQLGKDHLIESESDPFKFIRLYNEAARSCSSTCYLLSDRTMGVLAELQKKYVTK